MNWLFLVAFVFLASFAYAAVRGAPWVPTRKRDLNRILRLLEGKPGQTIYELGCGDGRVSALIARQTKANVTGIELSLAQWIAASIRGALYRATPSYEACPERSRRKEAGGSRAEDSAARGSLRFRLADVFRVDLSKADAVYVFLMPDTYAKLKPKFERELRPGTRVLTYVWPMEGWEPKVVDRMEGSESIYLYVR